MTVTAAPEAAVEYRPPAWSIVLALARLEGRKMLTHPVVWVGALASAALAVFELIEEAPVLNRVSMTLAWTMAPLAVAVALAAGWAVLRTKGRTDAHPPVIMPVSMGQRVGGILLGLLWPALTTFGLQLALLAWVWTRDPVTSMVWTELLVGPVYVMFAGSLAAALTRWIPHPSTPTFTLLLMAGLQIVVPYDSEQWGSQIGPAALAPIAWPENIIPYEVSFRPSVLHLGYLTGLVLVVAGFAVLSRRVTWWAVLGVGVILAAILGPAQLGPIEESVRIEAMSRLVGERADLTCETHDRITYCAMPGYEGWIDDWARGVKPVLEAAPATAQPIEVRQYPVHHTFLLDDETASESQWWWVAPASQDYASRNVIPVSSHFGDDTISYSLVYDLAYRMLGCDIECEGESQRVVYLWLVAHDSRIRENVEYDTSPKSDFATVDECMVAELWDQPSAKERIHGNWEVLTDPVTTYEEAGTILGVTVPEGYDRLGHLEGGCP